MANPVFLIYATACLLYGCFSVGCKVDSIRDDGFCANAPSGIYGRNYCRSTSLHSLLQNNAIQEIILSSAHNFYLLQGTSPLLTWLTALFSEVKGSHHTMRKQRGSKAFFPAKMMNLRRNKELNYFCKDN